MLRVKTLNARIFFFLQNLYLELGLGVELRELNQASWLRQVGTIYASPAPSGLGQSYSGSVRFGTV